MDLETLQTAIRSHWPAAPGDKARPYIGKFFQSTRVASQIVAKVQGNHGTYVVSIDAGSGRVSSACSCHIGMSTRHLSAVKSSELRNHFFNELGATKLACLWVLEHIKQH